MVKFQRSFGFLEICFLIFSLGLSACGDATATVNVAKPTAGVIPTTSASGGGTKMSLKEPLQIDLPKINWISSSPPRIPTLAISQDGKYLAVQGEQEREEGVFVWQLPDGKLVTQTKDFQAQRFLSFVGNTHQLVNELPLVWDFDSNKKVIEGGSATGLFTNEGQQDYDSSNFTSEAKVSPDGSVLFGHGLPDKASKFYVKPAFWNLQTGKLLYRFDMTPAAIAYTPAFNLQTNPTVVAVQSPDSSGRLTITSHNIATGQKTDEWSISQGSSKTAFFLLSPDGSTLITDGTDSGFWDVKTHKKIAPLPPKQLFGRFITPDNKYLIGENNNQLTVYEIPSGREVAKLNEVYKAKDSNGELKDTPLLLQSLTISPDGKYLAAAGNRTILVWSLAELNSSK